MTTVAEVDVKINAKLDSFLQSSKKAEKIINDLDKRLNKLSSKNIKATVSTKVGSTKDLALLERRLNFLNNKKFNATVTPKVGSTADLARLEQRLNNLGSKKANVKVDASSSTALSGMGGGLSSLSGIFAGVGAALSVDQIKDYADAWTEAGNKLRAAAEIAGVQTRSLEDLNVLAADTRSGITETVDLYSKLIRSASGVAKSENEIAIATATVNKAFKAGGATMQEQISGITQLGQALGSGVLQGDELRSLRENAPIIAQAIAKEFDTTIAGIKKLGEEGKLTSDRVFKAIVNAAGEVDAAFKKTNATIGDSFQQLGNKLTEYIGHMDKTYGITQTVNNILGALTNNIDSVANAAAAAGVVLLAAFGGSAALALANPWVALAAAVGVAAYAITDFWDVIVPLENSFATLGDYAQAAWSILGDGANAVKESVVSSFNTIVTAITSAMSGVGVSFGDVYNVLAFFINNTIENFMRMKDVVVATYTLLPQAVAGSIINAMNAMISGVVSGLNVVIEKTNQAIAIINKGRNALGAGNLPSFGLIDVESQKFTNPYENAGKAAAEAYTDAFTREAKDYLGSAGTAINGAIDGLTKRANDVAQARKELERETNKANNFAGIPPSGGISSAGYGGGVGGGGSSGSGKGKKPKQNEYEKEIQQIKDKTAALVAETEAQAKLNPLIEDYGYTTTRAKTAQELINAAQKAGIAGAKELTDVQKLLNGEFEGLSPTAKTLAESIVSLSTKYGEAEAASNRLAESQKMAKQAMDDTKQFSRDVMGGFISDLKEGKSATEALANALNKVADKLMEVGLDALFGTGNFKSSGGAFGGIFSSLFSGLSFEGGGYTGAGSRSGGLDGKGGYMAMVHPNETVIDHTKGIAVPRAQLRPSVGGNSGPSSIQIELVTNTDTGVITEIANTQIKSAAPTIIKTSVKESQKTTKKNMSGYMANAQARNN